MSTTYYGELDGQQFSVEPTPTRTEANEVKCRISWEDGQIDYIWFDDVGEYLICQLNPNIIVAKQFGYQPRNFH